MKRFINLLPEGHQRKLALKRFKEEIIFFGIWLLLSLFVTAALLNFGKRTLLAGLEETAIAVVAKEQALRALNYEILKQEVSDFNQGLANFKVLEQKGRGLAPILVEFAKLLPAGVSLEKLTLEAKSKRAEASGHATTREQVLELRKNLLSSSFFANLDFPLKNLEKAVDVSWKYRFYFNPQTVSSPN